MSWEKMTLTQRVQAANIDCMRHKEYALLSGIICMGKSEVTEKVPVPTAATDGRNKYYHPDFVKTLNRKQMRYVVLHENFHVALKHLVLYMPLWEKYGYICNIAADYVVNGIIEELDPQKTFVERCTEPKPLVDEKYAGWSFVQVLKDLLKDCPQGGEGEGEGDGDGEGDGEGDGTEGGSMDGHLWKAAKEAVKEAKAARALEREIDDANRQGELVRRKMAGNEKGGRDILGTIAERTTDWKEPLRDFIATICQGDDMSRYCPPNKRMLASGFIMPSHFTETIGEVILACDTSGSMHPYYPIVFGEIANIAKQVRPERIRMLWWDTSVCGDQVFEPKDYDDIAKQLRPAGGGGTTPTCVTEYIAEHEIKAKAIIWLSDGYLFCEDPPTPFPGLWGICGNDEFVPVHGKVIRIPEV
jgi:predicted metal-dependent peptidase